MGPPEGLFRRREIVEATEPARSEAPVVDRPAARRVQLGAVFALERRNGDPDPQAVEAVLAQVGLAPNGRPWDCGACGYATCGAFARAAVAGRTSLKSCPPFLERQTKAVRGEATQALAARGEAAQDGLTGLPTVGVLQERLASEVARSKRSGEPFALLFMDLDNLRQVNDRYGPAAGDALLKGAAEELAEVVRSTDFAARYGGDEFVVLLVRTGREGARLVAEKVRARVEQLGKALEYPPSLVTASIGVAAFTPRDHRHEDVLVAADRALYRAKVGGRNRVATGES
jgi:diguanylate cyclase